MTFKQGLGRVLMIALAAGAGAIWLVSAASADKGDVTCSAAPGEPFGIVTGEVPHDAIVPPNTICDINNAHVGHDVKLGHDSYVGISSTTIDHDIVGKQVSTLELGNTEPGLGPVHVGHDIKLSGAQNNTNFANGYTICDSTIDHDVTIDGTDTPFGTVIGDKGRGPEDFCADAINPVVSIGHDLMIRDNVFGRLDVGDNTIGHDMKILNNTATTAFGDEGTMDVSDNTVGHDALCSGNNPPPTPGGDGDGDGPNHAGHKNTCP
jgi:hypothetical protein